MQNFQLELNFLNLDSVGITCLSAGTVFHFYSMREFACKSTKWQAGQIWTTDLIDTGTYTCVYACTVKPLYNGHARGRKNVRNRGVSVQERGFEITLIKIKETCR
jgi:hypothetical protein